MKRNHVKQQRKQPPEDGRKSKSVSEMPKTTEITKSRLLGDKFEDEKKNIVTENNKSKSDITCGTSISKKNYTCNLMKTAEEDMYVINTLHKFGVDKRRLESFAVTNWQVFNRLSTAINYANSVGLDERLLFKFFFNEREYRQRNVTNNTELFFLIGNLSDYIERCYSHVRSELEKKRYVRLNRLPDKVCDAAKMQLCLGQKKSVMILSDSFPSNDYVSKSNYDENTTKSINFEKSERKDFKKICESDILLKRENEKNSLLLKNDKFLDETSVDKEERKNGTILSTAEEIDHPYNVDDVEKTTDKKSFDIESSSSSKFSNETNPRNADNCSCQSDKKYRSDITCGTSKKNCTFKLMKTAEEDMYVINSLHKFGVDERCLQSFAVTNWCVVNRLSTAISCANSVGLDEHLLFQLYFKEKESNQRNNVAEETELFFLFDNLSNYIEKWHSRVRRELEKKCYVLLNRLPDKVIFEKVCDAAKMQPCLGQKKSVTQLSDSFPSNDYVSKSNCKSDLDENTTESINFEKRKLKGLKKICESDILPKKEYENACQDENADGEISKNLVVILDEIEMFKSENVLEIADGPVYEENKKITKSALNVMSADKIMGIILSPDEDTAKDSTASKIKKLTFKEMEETNEKLKASKSQDIIGEEDHTITVISEVERKAHSAMEDFPSNDNIFKSNCKSDLHENTTESITFKKRKRKDLKKIRESDILLKKENEESSFLPKNGAVLSTAKETDNSYGDDDVEKTTDKNSFDIESSSNSKFPNETNPRNADKCSCQANISDAKSIKKCRCKKHFLKYTKIVSHGNGQLSKISYFPRGTSHFNDTSLDLIKTAQPFCRQNCMCDQTHENTDEKATENYKDEKDENAVGEGSKKLVVILDKITAEDSTASKIKKLAFKEMEEANVKLETSKSQDIIVEKDRAMRVMYEVHRNAHAAMENATEFALFGTEDDIVVPRPSTPWLHAPWLHEPTAENTPTDSSLAYEQDDFAFQLIFENNEETVQDIGNESTVDQEIDLTSLYPDIIFNESNDISDLRENNLRFMTGKNTVREFSEWRRQDD